MELGTHLYTRAGDDLGAIDKLIVDPTTDRVKAVAVRKGFILHRDVEVPVELLDAGHDGFPTLTGDAAELKPFDASLYTSPPPEYASASGRATEGVLFPVGYGSLVGPLGNPAPVGAETGLDAHVRGEIAAGLRTADLENEVVGKGSAVRSRDGEKVGEVADLTFEAQTGRLTYLVVRRGFLFHEDVALPADAIASVGDGVIHLNRDAAALRQPQRAR